MRKNALKFVFGLGFVLALGAGCTDSAPAPAASIPTNESPAPAKRLVVEGCPTFAEVISRKPDELASCFFKIHPKLSALEFRLNTAPSSEKESLILINKIDVFPAKAASAVQTLVTHMSEPPLEGTDYLLTEDMNFDGYNDLKLVTSAGATGNTHFDIWLFDATSSQFTFHEGLSGLTNPRTDLKNKTVNSFSHSSAAEFENQTFIWQSGQLVLTREVVQMYNQATDKITCTISERQNGKMIVIGKQNKACEL
jgi:hypothetical protein